MRYFNVAGPCNALEHYMVNAATRLQGVEQLIDRKQYFVIHAARQSGKTTYLNDLANRLNVGGQYYALYCSLESVQEITNYKEGIPAVLDGIVTALEKSNIPFEYSEKYELYKQRRPLLLLTIFLTDLAKKLDKPLVILFDEADCLSEATLISFLRQLRNGYNDRSTAPFPHSVALVGMRNIRDYKAKIRPDSASLGSASPFNIVTKTYTLQNFTKEEVALLYRQHTDDTGQVFESDAVELVYEQTQGQPWLVNAIANQVIVEMLQSDYAKPVTAALVSEAIQSIILNRPAHIDSLLERLREERVRRIVEPMIMGNKFISKESDDFLYAKELGLIRVESSRVMPANPIYAEVIVRKLSSDAQEDLNDPAYPYQMPRYLKGRQIDMDFLMRDFQQFWRENSDIWVEKVEYKEAAPHLVMMAFLQRVVNGGGQVIREMASGTGRIDLCLIYEGRKYPVEIKIRHGEKYLQEGIEQTARYMDVYGCAEGWLVVFDRRDAVKWDEKIYMRKEAVPPGKTVTVVGA